MCESQALKRSPLALPLDSKRPHDPPELCVGNPDTPASKRAGGGGGRVREQGDGGGVQCEEEKTKGSIRTEESME